MMRTNATDACPGLLAANRPKMRGATAPEREREREREREKERERQTDRQSQKQRQTDSYSEEN